MNKSFRIVFNKARNALMVVSEGVKSCRKNGSSGVTVQVLGERRKDVWGG